MGIQPSPGSVRIPSTVLPNLFQTLAAPPGFPPDVFPLDLITAAHMNAVRSSAALWPGNVDALNHKLSNVVLDQAKLGSDLDAQGFTIQNANFDAGSVAGVQTPWLQDIDGAGFSLLNAGRLAVAGSVVHIDYTAAGLTIHEATRSGTTTASVAPRITFYWPGVGAPQFGIDNTTAFRTFDASGTSYVDFKAQRISMNGGPAGSSVGLSWVAAGMIRFMFRLSNVTDDLILGGYDDSGAYLNNPLSIARATGQVSIPNLAVNGLSMNGNLDMGGWPIVNGGTAEFAGWAATASTDGAGVRLREYQRLGAQAGAVDRSPRLAFYWSGIAAVQIGLDATGTIRTFDQAGGGFAPFAAAGITSTGWEGGPGLRTSHTFGINLDQNNNHIWNGPALFWSASNQVTGGNIFVGFSPARTAGSPASFTHFPLNFTNTETRIGAPQVEKVQIDSPYLYAPRIVQPGDQFHSWNMTDFGGQWRHLATGYGNIITSSIGDGLLRIYAGPSAAAGAIGSPVVVAAFGPSGVTFPTIQVSQREVTAGGSATYVFQSAAGYSQWQTGLGGSPGNYVISRFNDAGAYLDNPLTISRATGNVSLQNALTFANVFGSKVVLWDTGTGINHAMGVEAGAMWQQVPTGATFRWYIGAVDGGSSNRMGLDSSAFRVNVPQFILNGWGSHPGIHFSSNSNVRFSLGVNKDAWLFDINAYDVNGNPTSSPLRILNTGQVMILAAASVSDAYLQMYGVYFTAISSTQVQLRMKGGDGTTRGVVLNLT